MRFLSWPLAGALLLAGGSAIAGPGASASAPLKPAPSGSGAVQRDAGPRETPEQRAYRMKYMGEVSKHQAEITKDKVWTPEMVKASGEHWRRAFRALRVRELAEDDKDEKLVARVDAFLKKIDAHYFPFLTELAAKAPSIPPPPSLTSPAAEAELKVGSPTTFKMAPYKDAAQYFCTLYQPGHYWSNYAGPGKYGATNECTIPADDPKWGKFTSGKAHFVGRAIIKTKSAKGADMNIWSKPVSVEVVLAGGAAPAGSGSGATPPAKPPASGGSK